MIFSCTHIDCRRLPEEKKYEEVDAPDPARALRIFLKRDFGIGGFDLLVGKSYASLQDANGINTWRVDEKKEIRYAP